MISVEQALEKILDYVTVMDEEERPILDCLGQVLAEEITSNINIPPLDNTAMDGYAVRSIDTRGASPQSPRILQVIETLAAGSISESELKPAASVSIT